MTKFDEIIREFVDIHDTDTRRYLLSLTEAQQNMALSNLTSRLYDKIVEKVDDIDFGTIPKSRGDITKIENFDSMVECINIMRDIIKQYNQPTDAIDVVSTAIDNVRNRERNFSKAFALGKEYPMLIYNTITLSIVSAVSFLISSCIEYIKDAGAETYQIALDKTAYKRSMNSVLLANLSKFNNSCKNGDMDKSINAIMQAPVKEGVIKNIGYDIVAGAMIFFGIIKNIIPMLRELVFYFFHLRMKVSDYFSTQAELLEMNATNIMYKTDISMEERTNIKKKQTKIASAFRKIANVFDIKNKTAEKTAEKDIKNMDNTFKKEDLYDDQDSIF